MSENPNNLPEWAAELPTEIQNAIASGSPFDALDLMLTFRMPLSAPLCGWATEQINALRPGKRPVLIEPYENRYRVSIRR